jgi:hypothetical protein
MNNPLIAQQANSINTFRQKFFAVFAACAIVSSMMMEDAMTWSPNASGDLDDLPKHPENAAFVEGWKAAVCAARNVVEYHSTGRKDAAAKVYALMADDAVADAIFAQHAEAGGCHQCEKPATRFCEANGDAWCDDCAPGAVPQ